MELYTQTFFSDIIYIRRIDFTCPVCYVFCWFCLYVLFTFFILLTLIPIFKFCFSSFLLITYGILWIYNCLSLLFICLFSILLISCWIILCLYPNLLLTLNIQCISALRFSSILQCIYALLMYSPKAASSYWIGW